MGKKTSVAAEASTSTSNVAAAGSTTGKGLTSDRDVGVQTTATTAAGAAAAEDEGVEDPANVDADAEAILNNMLGLPAGDETWRRRFHFPLPTHAPTC